MFLVNMLNMVKKWIPLIEFRLFSKQKPAIKNIKTFIEYTLLVTVNIFMTSNS